MDGSGPAMKLTSENVCKIWCVRSTRNSRTKSYNIKINTQSLYSLVSLACTDHHRHNYCCFVANARASMAVALDTNSAIEPHRVPPPPPSSSPAPRAVAVVSRAFAADTREASAVVSVDVSTQLQRLAIDSALDRRQIVLAIERVSHAAAAGSRPLAPPLRSVMCRESGRAMLDCVRGMARRRRLSLMRTRRRFEKICVSISLSKRIERCVI